MSSPRRPGTRITAGLFRGLSLVMPPEIRATESKVRQALFNILGESIRGARVIDGFAGSGVLGIEAFSRGAAFVAFIEQDGTCVVSIRDNLARLDPELPSQAWRVLHMDVVRGFHEVAASEPPFDVVLLDPPYRTDDGKKALIALSQYAMLAPTSIVVIEHERWTVLPLVSGPLHQRTQHRYGDTVLSFYQLS